MARTAQDFVTPEGRYGERASAASGVPGGQNGMAPYPLYGLGQTEAPIAWYKRPLVVLPVGVAFGVGLGYLYWGWLKPKMKPKKNPKKADD